MEAKAITAIVCLSEGMTLTIQLKQMKLFTAIAPAVVLGGALINPVPAKASTLVDLMEGTVTMINDGNPHHYIVQGARTYKTHTPDQYHAYPLKGAAPGTKQTRQLSRESHQFFAKIFYEADRAGDTYRNAVN
tara:strand:+ start:146 stop:544 length:399 start_codon:yes stop_codon:yes gene_type:complete